jgi:hypothetical protein
MLSHGRLLLARDWEAQREGRLAGAGVFADGASVLTVARVTEGWVVAALAHISDFEGDPLRVGAPRLVSKPAPDYLVCPILNFCVAHFLILCLLLRFRWASAQVVK